MYKFIKLTFGWLFYLMFILSFPLVALIVLTDADDWTEWRYTFVDFYTYLFEQLILGE